jgi:non-homologous end joining protein Ku
LSLGVTDFSKDYFDEIPDVKIASDMLKLAVVEMIKRKRVGLPAEPQRVSTNAPNVSLIDALRRSIAEDKGAKAPASSSFPPFEKAKNKKQHHRADKRVDGQGSHPRAEVEV